MAQSEASGFEFSCDPADYAKKKLPAEIINFLLQKRSDMSLKDKYSHAEWKYRFLPDKTKQARSWLVYSPRKDAVYCLHCLIFGCPIGNKSTGLTRFAISGYDDWKNANRDVPHHEQSKYHTESDLALIRWNMSNHRLDKQLANQYNDRVAHYRAVLSVVIDCARYLTKEMSAFRNSSNLKGKLFNLFGLLAKYNPDAKMYYEKVKTSHKEQKRLRVNFLAYESVSNLLNIMKECVIHKICERVTKNGGSFSLIADSTQDSSKMESTVVLICYIEDFQEDSSILAHPIAV